MAGEAKRTRWRVSGTDGAGVANTLTIEASSRDSAINAARKQGMTVTSAMEDSPPPIRNTGGPACGPVTLEDVSASTAMKFGFYATIGAAFVLMVVGVLLVIIVSALGYGLTR